MGRFHVDPNERVEIKEFEPGAVLDETGQPAIPNVIYIRARMNVAIQDKVAGATVQMGKDGTATGMDMGPYLTALLVHNILAWAGPDFDGLPCTPENIENLPGGDPFIERVRNEIAERNKSITPKKSAATVNAGSISSITLPSQESLSLQLATGHSTSPLQSAINGRLGKSENSIPNS